MAVVFLSITPIGTATPSVSRYVAGVEEVLRESGLVSQLTAMGTLIEGDLDEILKVVRRMHEHPFTRGAVRVSTLLKIDDRRDKEHTIARKMRSVEEKLGKESGE
ncbi:MAG TPA: MTH1187 family thiamine-binding protein [Anaeromyxobacteraceae bacterium]|nr:MTH1187 family thiamine-binding protein [Anaeromyxobacteraceae bacterium]